MTPQNHTLMNRWQNIVEKQNTKHYSIPKGWDTRDQVAEDLECSPERVTQILAPGIRSGAIQTQKFSVWDPVLKRVNVVTCFREAPVGAEAPPKAKPEPKPKHSVGEDDLAQTVQRILVRRPGLDVGGVCKLLPRRFRGVAKSTDIRAVWPE